MKLLSFATLFCFLSMADSKNHNNDQDSAMIYYTCESDANCGGPTQRCADVTISY